MAKENKMIRAFKIRTPMDTSLYISQVLRTFPNQADADLIREILYTSMTTRDWEFALTAIHKYHPETQPDTEPLEQPSPVRGTKGEM